jgi:ubiquinone/menaquinone biosynthesis C-methylase UbiE
VVGRYILAHLADPAGALRRLARLVRPGGVLVFHEVEFDTPITLWPEAPLWAWAYGLLAKGVCSAGVPPDFGKRLGRTFLDAGLPWPTLSGIVPVGGGAGSYLYSWLAESLRTLLPILERAGLTTADELQVDTLAARLEAEAVGLGCQVMAAIQFGAWATRP